MIRHRPHREVLEDLRYALEVMEENSHLGLDDPAANALRSRLLGQITKVEAAIARESAISAPLIPPALELPE
jgi:hypothetical protein